ARRWLAGESVEYLAPGLLVRAVGVLAGRGRGERDPALAGEVHLGPGESVATADRPGAVGVALARPESADHPGGQPHGAGDHRERGGELLGGARLGARFGLGTRADAGEQECGQAGVGGAGGGGRVQATAFAYRALDEYGLLERRTRAAHDPLGVLGEQV